MSRYVLALIAAAAVCLIVPGGVGAVPHAPSVVAKPPTLAQAVADLADLAERRSTGGPMAEVCSRATIFSEHAKRYVATEMNEGRLLRARTPVDEVGPWEQFAICQDFATGVVTIRSIHADLFLATELNERGLLRARTPGDEVGSWERFRIDPVPGADPQFYLYSFSADAYVATEMNEGALLRARTPVGSAGDWERFS